MRFSLKCLISFFLLFSLISCKSQFSCDSFKDSPDSKSGENKYRIVHEWKDSDNTYNYLAKFHGLPEYEHHKNSKIVRCLHVKLTFHSKNNLRVKIIDASSERWEIPEASPYPHYRSSNLIPKEESCCTVSFHDPFAFSIVNKQTNEVIFDTRNTTLIYTDYFIELSTTIPSDKVYGFGERAYKFKLKPGTYTMWNRDEPDVLEDGFGGGNTYSHHPVGLFRGEKGNFFITFMRNSNAKDVIIHPNKTFTYKMTGGVIDLLFFIGDEYPDTAVKRYHEYIGKFALMPFWSMGNHQSRWGYTNVDKYEDLVYKFRKFDIPLDVLWSDVDYMILKETFTVDTVNFPPDRMRKIIHDQGIKWVPIIDCAIKVDKVLNQQVASRALAEGIKRDIFLKNSHGDYMLAHVWPGGCFYPDFFHPNAKGYWHDMLEDLYKIIPFSGIWLDMNEVTNFANGECQVLKNELRDKTGRISPYSSIPYLPGRRDLEIKTSSLDAIHHGGVLEYNAHDLFTLIEANVTYEYMKKKTKLPFILTRASFAGNGQYTAHWSGDNAARWEFLQTSIPGVFNFQIFGMPFSGSDICGFMRTTTPELCLRWYQTGAFYPFTRNHNNDMAAEQEPWVFIGRPLGNEMLGTAQASLKARYAILKWYYSLFVAAQGLGSIFRPLFFEFPDEEPLYRFDGPTETQFLLGSSLMVTPQLLQNGKSYSAYFPKDSWFDFKTGQKIRDVEDKDRFRTIATPMNASAPMFIRAGHIVHSQDVTRVLNTEDLNDEFELVIAFSRNPKTGVLESKGSIMGVKKFDEDTVHDKCVLNNCFYDIKAFVSEEGMIDMTLNIKLEKQQRSKLKLDSLGIIGVKLYNFPLRFMDEDECRIANTIGWISGGRGGSEFKNIFTREAISAHQDVFTIKFIETAWIKEGDTIGIKVIL